MLELKGFHRIKAMDDDNDDGGGGTQFHIPIHLIPVTSSMDFPTIPCGPELLPQCPVGICGSQTKAPGQPGPQLNMLKKHWSNSFSSLCTPFSLYFTLSPSFFLSLTHPPPSPPPPSSSYFIRGTEGGKETLIPQKREEEEKQ